MLLLNDETNTIFLHRADRTGRPVKTWTFTSAQLGTSGEIDFEGIARSGDRLVLTGSHGNNRSGAVRPERRTLVGATITGSGAGTELAFAGRYNGLWNDLLAWDQGNGNALGLTAAAAPGVLPNAPGGFNIEAAEYAPDGETLYLGFRAPTVGPDHDALVVPVTNVEDLLDGTGPAAFGDPILLDLDGRSVRALASNGAGGYLISAGASPQNDSWALYTWDGRADHAPAFNRELPADDGLTRGPWESIASVPDPLETGATVRLVTDSGDTNFYGTGATKDVAAGFQKSYSQDFELGAVPAADPGRVVITEWMYDGPGGEFVELTNVGGQPVDLTGWTYDDDSADPAVGFDLSGLGTLAPGESGVFVEATPAAFRTQWGLCSTAKVTGPYTNNLGRADQVNIFDADDQLVDRLTYGDNQAQFAGSIRTQNASGWVSADGLGADDVFDWTLSTTGGDPEGSWAAGGAVGSPGVSFHGGYDPCAPVDLTLVGINDFHGRIDQNTVNFAGTVEQLRAAGGEDDTLFLSSGDNIGASLFASAVQQDQPTIDVLNALDLGASAVGNHEFDQGWPDLRDRVIGAAEPNAQWTHLGANVYAAGTEDPVLPEYATFERAGLTVAVVGVVTQETPSLVSPAGVADLDFGDPVEAVNRVAAELSDGNPANGEADVIVASYHEGGGNNGTTLDEELAHGGVFADIVEETSAEVDAIFTGHTHKTYAWEGPVPGDAERARPIVQTGNYGENVGEVVLTVDPATGEVLAHTQRNVARTTTPAATLVATYPRVAAVKTIVDAALGVAAEVGNQPVGEVTADITTAFVGGARDDRAAESTLGNLVADSLLDTLADPDRGGAQIGVVNPGGLRAELLYAQSTVGEGDGVVTYAEANAVLPFVNTLWTTTLTGAQFKTLLEQQWQRDAQGNVPSRPYLQLGLSDNVSYTFDPARPEGDRITSITVDGAPIDPAADYRIGTFSFLVEGGDNFHVFRDGTDGRDSGLIDRDAWITFIGDNSPLAPGFARRSTIVTGLPETVAAGSTLSFGVERLDLTSLGSPANTEVEVFLDGASLGTAPVSNGAAGIAVPVPAGTPAGDHELTVVAAPSQTTIVRTLTVTSVARATVADFDGDGTTDRSVWRPATGEWFVDASGSPMALGLATDVPVPADYDGDGIVERAVFRPSTATWYVDGAEGPTTFGAAGDVPVPADYDGDGTAEVAVFRPATGAWHVEGTATPTYLGLTGDVPVPGDYDGDGTTEPAVFRPASGGWYVEGAATPTFHGLTGDVPVPGDYDGDGATDIAVFRPTGGGWYVDGGAEPTFHGLHEDVPVPGDYDGDGTTDIAVFRPAAGGWYVRNAPTTYFGLPSDTQLVLPAAIARAGVTPTP